MDPLTEIDPVHRFGTEDTHHVTPRGFGGRHRGVRHLIGGWGQREQLLADPSKVEHRADGDTHEVRQTSKGGDIGVGERVRTGGVHC